MPDGQPAAPPKRRETQPPATASQAPRHVPASAMQSGADTDPPKAAAQETPAPQPKAAPAAEEAKPEARTESVAQSDTGSPKGVEKQTTFLVALCANDSVGAVVPVRAANPQQAALLARQHAEFGEFEGFAHVTVLLAYPLHDELIKL